MGVIEKAEIVISDIGSFLTSLKKNQSAIKTAVVVISTATVATGLASMIYIAKSIN